jgi:hypothetical protein
VADGEVLVFREEMTISREAFLRSLPAAVGHEPFEVAGDAIRHRGTERAWRITLAPLPDLTLGLLALPRHRVCIHVEGYGEAERQRFLDRFELHFRRAGG